jgi:hypothetical protein
MNVSWFPEIKHQKELSKADVIRRSGAATRLLQEENLLKALSDPISFINTRKETIKSWFDEKGAIMIAYNDTYNQYAELGYPSDVCDEKAMEFCTKIFNHKIEIEEIHSPGGYQKIMNTYDSGKNIVPQTPEQKQFRFTKKLEKAVKTHGPNPQSQTKPNED